MSTRYDSQRPPLAVVGLSALFPGSTDASGFWRDIMTGRDLIEEVPPHYWLVEDFYDPDPTRQDKTYCKRGSFLSKVDFDPMEFGIPPANLPSTDTCQLLALIVAKQVLEDAQKGSFSTIPRERISVILGVAAGLELVGEMAGRLQRPLWQKALREHGLPEDEVQAICNRISSNSVPWTESSFPGLLGNVVAGRIANRFDLGGTNCTTDAACASSFSALSMAANELYLGDSDLVITGGVDTTNDPFLFLCFCKTPAMSFKNDCRPFSDQADGTMLGEGLGMVALRRLEDAERDGDRIYAVIRGIGTSSDGRAKSVYAPRPEGQSRALRLAYRHAGYGPETVELLEAHGTGTVAGDMAEFLGASQVFDESGRPDRGWCALGTVKSQFGHTKAAAGVAGLIKVVLALRHRVLPPIIKVDRPDPRLGLEKSPFYLNTATRPWVRGSDHPRRASVSSFGFGGTNFHVAVEEYRGPGQLADRRRAHPSELLLFSAASTVELGQRLRQEARACDGTDGQLTYLAWQSQATFDAAAPVRLGLVVGTNDDLAGRLLQAASTVEHRPEQSFSLPTGLYVGCGPALDGVALLFPGQGSQYVGMGADLCMGFEEAMAVWDRTADLALDGAARLHEVVFPRPVFSDEERQAQQRRLTATEWAQPALGAASLATLALLRALGIAPVSLGGHSFGEVTALAAAGVLSEADLLRIARRRGELMAQAAGEPGAMLAVVHPLPALRELLASKVQGVVIANINSPRQVVLSGRVEAIRAAEALLEEDGIATRRLPVATAFHSPLVEPSREPFLRFLQDIPFKAPSVPVYANAEAAPYPADPAAMRALLAAQIARPVRFVEQVQAMWEAGARVFVEAGPGSVQTGLLDPCLEGRPHLAVAMDRRGVHGVTALWQALAQLAVAGVRFDVSPLWQRDAPTDPRTRRKPILTVKIDGVNYGKLYPPPGGRAALPGPNPPRPTETPEAVRVASSSPASASTEGLGAWPEAAVAPARPAIEATLPAASQQGVPSLRLDPALDEAGQADWLRTFRAIQRQTAEAHQTFQQAMAESHLAFLDLARSSGGSLSASISDGARPLSVGAEALRDERTSHLAPGTADRPMSLSGALADEDRVVRPTAVATAQAPSPSTPGPEARTAQPPRSEPMPLPSVPGFPEAEPRIEPAPASVDASAQAIAALAPPAPSPTGPAPGDDRVGRIDPRALLLAVVAEKTGYPEEILTLEMDLEADLGIDSIKRVEILSALQERTPHLPEIDAAAIPTLQTLGQVLQFLERFDPGGKGSGGGNGTGHPTLDRPQDPMTRTSAPFEGGPGAS